MKTMNQNEKETSCATVEKQKMTSFEKKSISIFTDLIVCGVLIIVSLGIYKQHFSDTKTNSDNIDDNVNTALSQSANDVKTSWEVVSADLPEENIIIDSVDSITPMSPADVNSDHDDTMFLRISLENDMTLETIARIHARNLEDVYKLNPEIKPGSMIPAETIVKIPLF